MTLNRLLQVIRFFAGLIVVGAIFSIRAKEIEGKSIDGQVNAKR